jgi:hypothetical protein
MTGNLDSRLATALRKAAGQRSDSGAHHAE